MLAGALWPMPAWVWRDVRFFYFFLFFFAHGLNTAQARPNSLPPDSTAPTRRRPASRACMHDWPASTMFSCVTPVVPVGLRIYLAHAYIRLA